MTHYYKKTTAKIHMLNICDYTNLVDNITINIALHIIHMVLQRYYAIIFNKLSSHLFLLTVHPTLSQMAILKKS